MESSEQRESPSSNRALRQKFDAWCERGILTLVLVSVLFAPVAWGTVRPRDFVVLQFLTAGTLGLWLLRFWFGKKQRLLWTPLSWVAIVFVCYAVLRYMRADVEYVARQELLRVLVYAGLFFAALNNLHRQQLTRVVVLSLIALGTVLSMYAVYQWMSGTEYVLGLLKPHLYLRRGSGSFIRPDHLAGFLCLLLPVALSYTLTGRWKAVPRVLLGYAAVVMMAGMAVAGSVVGWAVGGILVLVFFILLLRNRSNRRIAITCMVLILAGAGWFAAHSIQLRRITPDPAAQQDTLMRFRVWPAAWRMWLDHAWIGVGPGHFDLRFRAYRTAEDRVQAQPLYAHNDLLNTLADWGLVGTVLAATAWAVLYFGVIRGWRFIRRESSDLGQKKSNKSAFVLGATLGLSGLLLFSLVDFTFQIPGIAVPAVVLMALVTGHLRFSSDRYWVSSRMGWQLAASVVLVALTGALAAEGVRSVRELHWLSQAETGAGGLPKRIEALKRAINIEPTNGETAFEIGETLRQQGWDAAEGGTALLEEAVKWFQRSSGLNPFAVRSLIRQGSCLDRLGRHGEADAVFQRALALDPHGSMTLTHLGWHHIQCGKEEEARRDLKRALQLNPGNTLAAHYLKWLDERSSQDGTK